jgi:membrane-associated phospholipid phosphatase
MGSRIVLPPLIRRYRWTFTYLLAWAPYIAVYQITNRWLLREPMVLPFTALDEGIPFVPALLPIYVAYIPFFLWTLGRSEDDDAANRIFYATHFELLLSVPFFVLVPVAMPRELFYGPELYGWADAFWRWFDAPHNCFPSLHTSNCLMLIHFNRTRRGRIPATLAAVAIIASTLFVKQHYAVDLLGGVLVYVAARMFLGRLEIAGVDQVGWSLTRAAR